MSEKETTFLKTEITDCSGSLFSIQNLKTSSEIALPLFDRHGDQISVDVENDGDRYLVSDDGYIVNDLIASGIKLTDQRLEAIKRICKQNSVVFDEEDFELRIHCSQADLAQTIHSFGQILTQISDLQKKPKNTAKFGSPENSNKAGIDCQFCFF